MPAAVVTARRRELLAEFPERAAEAQRPPRPRPRWRASSGTPAAARQAYEAALAADPLDLATLDAYVAYRRQAGEGGLESRARV